MKKGDKVAVIGLGYVGLPLAVEFGKQVLVVGFDVNKARIEELKSGRDRTLEVEKKDLLLSKKLKYSTDVNDLRDCNYFIVTVPTPIYKNKQPNLMPLQKATETVAKVLKKGDIVIYESTVYPGTTEEVCVPILEGGSGLKFNEDFACGYSPERMNPGDKEHNLKTLIKVTSGSNKETAKKVDDLYKLVAKAGTHLASSIKVAEAAKVIENAQRDLNIAFVNELALLFNRLEIDTKEVLDAAGTKWNFLPFRPGLVGGHCIGVDPYYLLHKAHEVGYNPEIITAGRRLNDSMGAYIADRVLKLMVKKGQKVLDSKVLVLGITFKENCPDIRNSRVIDIVREMQDFGCKVEVYDPWASKEEVKKEYRVNLLSKLGKGKYDAVIMAVAHDKFKRIKLKDLKKKETVVYDVKGVLGYDESDERL